MTCTELIRAAVDRRRLKGLKRRLLYYVITGKPNIDKGAMEWFGGSGGSGDALPISLAPLQRAWATVLVVMPRVFAPQFVTYDLQFHRCLSLRIEIYGHTQSVGARRDKVTRAESARVIRACLATSRYEESLVCILIERQFH